MLAGCPTSLKPMVLYLFTHLQGRIIFYQSAGSEKHSSPTCKASNYVPIKNSIDDCKIGNPEAIS